MRLRMIVMVLASSAILLVSAPSYAQTASTLTVAGSTTRTISPNLQNRLKLVCARVPNLTTRTNNLMTRLPAGPDTKGSIAWAQAKAQLATQRHMPAVATALTNRANVMTQKLATLPNQLALLQKAEALCTRTGFAS